MDELKKEKNRLALEKIELLDKIAHYQDREDLSRDDKQDALEELNDRLKELEDKLTKVRQEYNTAVSQERHETDTVKYEQTRNRRESVQNHEENKAKYEQVRADRKAEEDLLIKFISQNESARNEFMRGMSSQEIRQRHAAEIEAFAKSLNAPVENDINEPQEEIQEDRVMTDEEGQQLMMRMGKENYLNNSQDDAKIIENGQVSDEEARNMMVNAGKDNTNTESENNAQAIESGQVSDEEAQNMMANEGKNQNAVDVDVKVESENKGRQLVNKISEAPQKIKEKLTANNNKAIKAIAIVVAAGTIVLTAGAALGVGPAAIAAAGAAGYGVHEFNKGKKM